MSRSTMLCVVAIVAMAQPASLRPQTPPMTADAIDAQVRAFSKQINANDAAHTGLPKTCENLLRLKTLVQEALDLLNKAKALQDLSFKDKKSNYDNALQNAEYARRNYGKAVEQLQALEAKCAQAQAGPGSDIGVVKSSSQTTTPEQYYPPDDDSNPLYALEYQYRWANIRYGAHSQAAANCDRHGMEQQRTLLSVLTKSARSWAERLDRLKKRGKATQQQVNQGKAYADAIEALWRAALAQPLLNCPTAPEKAIQVPSPPTTPVPPSKGTQDCPSPGTPGDTTLPGHGMRFTVPNKNAQRMLAAHNRARAEVGVPALIWDRELAAGAAQYAEQMSAVGRAHASREGRKCIRENLLQSLPGSRSPEQMVGVWLAEKASFKPGVFPDVSTTGDWAQVGHYTQIIWATTTHVGCATHTGAGYDWTVCRYTPPGNQDGKNVLGVPPVSKQPLPSGPVPIPYPSTQQPEPPTG